MVLSRSWINIKVYRVSSLWSTFSLMTLFFETGLLDNWNLRSFDILPLVGLQYFCQCYKITKSYSFELENQVKAVVLKKVGNFLGKSFGGIFEWCFITYFWYVLFWANMCYRHCLEFLLTLIGISFSPLPGKRSFL